MGSILVSIKVFRLLPSQLAKLEPYPPSRYQWLGDATAWLRHDNEGLLRVLIKNIPDFRYQV